MAVKNWIKIFQNAKTKAEARQVAIDFQAWSSVKALSYGELANYQHHLTVLAKRFGLVKEFRENGVI